MVPIITFVSVFILNIFTLYAYYNSKTLGVQDIPNERSMHKKTTKKSAGVVFVIITIFSMLFLKFFLNVEIKYFYPLLLGIGFTSTLGLFDDIYKLSSVFRFVTELVFFFFLGYFFLPEFQILGLNLFQNQLFNYAILSVYFVFIINITNFMDGIDMYLSLILFVVIINFSMISSYFLLQEYTFYILSVGILAFLFFNSPPAKLFMGDSGSLPLGFLIAILPFFHSKPTVEIAEIGFLVPVFLIDGISTIVKRIFHKKNIFLAHREHLYQRISDSIFTKKQTAIIFSLFNLGGGIIYFLFYNKSVNFVLLLTGNLVLYQSLYFYLNKKCRLEKKGK
ncbi:MAG: hypothetical protein L6Q54_02390 [Leptospiraceae bacterium]|nr:hypothetical protein [Leptospiraceae bacterium]MCK6380087.1 hypothetical protein [Leptospiraceae bacterium]NUM40472.1 hypothetical protein [Leptospiraceae bacterium]